MQNIGSLAQTAPTFKNLAEYIVEAVKDITGANVSLWRMSNRDDEGSNFREVALITVFRVEKLELDHLPAVASHSDNVCS